MVIKRRQKWHRILKRQILSEREKEQPRARKEKK
jgi:hypothetical protein